ncbi:helix-turn-helix domain-containing protein [Pigmentiphaga sp. GD03639]|uniref:helix-turn-helix domain-containing protein n=1 Tax=Pigmentiphaga sp. GD03639 TaxID=2975354 RepID=UPI00244CD17A|nr:helix-turn-helix domain-containing protein [Pigmentiphaga sp. GD03639]MDH2235037.1 helix-turn-helix domain-containing protein [Pigmentiphaga sp. GD03639]
MGVSRPVGEEIDLSSPYKQVRSIQRGLDVLLCLNLHGPLSVQGLSHHTGLTRATLYRIVETLETLGYVSRATLDDTVRLTSKVLSLSNGYEQGEELAAAAKDALLFLLSCTGWPSSVGTLCKDSMLIRETTHGRAEVFVRNTLVGTKSPVLTTAMGRSYLSFCDDDERQKSLSTIAHSSSTEAELARDMAYVSRLVSETREAGFGFGAGYPDLGGIALPIRFRRKVVAGLNIVFRRSFIAPNKAIDKFLPPLADAVSMIERNLEQQSSIR